MTPTSIRQFEQAIDDALERWDLAAAERLAADYLTAAAYAPLDAMTRDRSPRFRAGFVAAQVALLAGRLGRVIELLTPLVALAEPAAAPLGAKVRLLLAEAHARLNHPGEARSLLAEVPASRLEDDIDQRLRALRIRLCLGTHDVAEDELHRCAADLARQGKHEAEALLWCDAGRAHDAAGNLSGAENCWRRAEQGSRGTGLQPVHADALLQLGRLEHLHGQPGPALDLYKRAGEHGLPVQVLEARLRRLLVLLDLDRWSTVRAEAAELLPADLASLPEELRPLARFVPAVLDGGGSSNPSPAQEGYNAARQGREEEARALYTAALAAAEGPERRAPLCLALGLLSGSGSEAESWLRQAERLARSANLAEVLVRTLSARGERAAASQHGEEEEARPLFEEAVVLSEVQGAELPPPLRPRRHTVLRHLVEAACRRGDPAEVFRYQERERGRLLLEWLAAGPGPQGRPPLFDRPDWQLLAGQIATCEDELRSAVGARRAALRRQREVLLVSRDALFERHLIDRDRPGGALLPPVPDLAELASCLPAGTLYVAPVLARDGLYLLGVTRDGPARLVPGGGPADAVTNAVDALRGEMETQLARYQRGWPLGAGDRAELDRRLDDLGRGPLGRALNALLNQDGPQHLIWAPDPALHGLPIHAVRLGGQYLIERVAVTWTFAGALVVQQHRTRRQRRWVWRPVVAVADGADALPAAGREAEGVAAAFLRGSSRTGVSADRRWLRGWLARARLIHLACHAEFDSARPLTAYLRLPSNEALHALEWLEEPVRGLPLMTLSACRSAAVAPLAGGEAFGLVTGLLAAGVRAVIAGLWPVADERTPPLMWSFYRHLLLEPLPAALAAAQREALAGPDASPLFWAAFALFGDPDAIPAAPRPWRWLLRWRQRRHARQYAGPAER
jgi:CHAT domain-containing protein/tetratricopeptide (TPR) repeat protein